MNRRRRVGRDHRSWPSWAAPPTVDQPQAQRQTQRAPRPAARRSLPRGSTADSVQRHKKRVAENGGSLLPLLTLTRNCHREAFNLVLFVVNDEPFRVRRKRALAKAVEFLEYPDMRIGPGCPPRISLVEFRYLRRYGIGAVSPFRSK